MADITIRSVVDNSVVILSRVSDLTGVDITRASLTALTWKLTRVSNSAIVVNETALTINSQVYDTLQTFTYPDGSTFQYNFTFTVNGTYLSVADESYIARFKFVDSLSQPFYLDVLHVVTPVASDNPQTLDLSLSDTISLDDGNNNNSQLIYGSVTDANIYFANRLKSDVWEEATEKDRSLALLEATQRIENLRFDGQKAVSTQTLSFPRKYVTQDNVVSPTYITQTSIPANIIKACYEEAISVLSDDDQQLAFNNLNRKRSQVGSVEAEYFDMGQQAHILAGILSIRAWRLLLPYIKDSREVTLLRV